MSDIKWRVGEAVRFCARPHCLRRSLATAAVVGVILSLINQADVVIEGEAEGGTWIKIGLNFVVPFIVTNVGLLAGRVERG